jgi:hypothetical protein
METYLKAHEAATIADHLQAMAGMTPRSELERLAIEYIGSIESIATADNEDRIKSYLAGCTPLSFIHEHYRARELRQGRPIALLVADHLRGDEAIWGRIKATKETAQV